jgi:hypothetical protein
VTVNGYLAPSHGEQTRLLSQACPAISITEDVAKADFVLRWESKTWGQTSWHGHQQEYTLFNPDKDVLATGASHQIRTAAKDICKLIESKATAEHPLLQSASH